MTDKNHLKIAVLGHKRVPSREGGIEIVVEELSTRMVQQGHTVTCFNRSGHHVSGKEFDGQKLKEYKGIKIKTVFTINRKGIAAMTSSIFAALKAAFGKYDIIHFHAEGPCAMLWIPKLFGKHCVVTIHGLDHQRAKWRKLERTYIMLGERCAVKYADEIIVLSKGVQNYFKEIYGRKTRYIPNGVNKAIIRKADLIKKKFGLEKDSYILFLGRIVPEKGLKYLITAYKQLKTAKKLVIAGGSSDTDDFINELMLMAKGNNEIIFTGFVQNEILDELYSNAYIYTLPSDLEGMPLSLLEAMNYGNCCVVSDINECMEVVEDKAVIFKKSDIEDLKEKLQILCDNSNIVENYKKNAADFICNKCNWDKSTHEIIELYKSVCL